MGVISEVQSSALRSFFIVYKLIVSVSVGSKYEIEISATTNELTDSLNLKSFSWSKYILLNYII